MKSSKGTSTSRTNICLVKNKPFELDEYEKQLIAALQRASSVFTIAPHYEVLGQPRSILEAVNIGEMLVFQFF